MHEPLKTDERVALETALPASEAPILSPLKVFVGNSGLLGRGQRFDFAFISVHPQNGGHRCDYHRLSIVPEEKWVEFRRGTYSDFWPPGKPLEDMFENFFHSGGGRPGGLVKPHTESREGSPISVHRHADGLTFSFDQVITMPDDYNGRAKPEVAFTVKATVVGTILNFEIVDTIKFVGIAEQKEALLTGVLLPTDPSLGERMPYSDAAVAGLLMEAQALIIANTPPKAPGAFSAAALSKKVAPLRAWLNSPVGAKNQPQP
jgi:hypothetical protein